MVESEERTTRAHRSEAPAASREHQLGGCRREAIAVGTSPRRCTPHARLGLSRILLLLKPQESETKKIAEKDIGATLRKLKGEVRALNQDKMFYTKLDAGPLRESVDGTRYGKACRLSMFRRRSAYEMLAG